MATTGDLAGQTVLVTGGAGFIGSAISQTVAPLVERFIALDNLHRQVHPTGERPTTLHAAAELRVCDVTDAATWDDILAEVHPDIVIHLAAETGTGQSLSESTRHGLVNVVGTTQLLDGLTRADVTPGHLLLSSSRAVYGEGAWQDAAGRVFYPGQRDHVQLAAGQWDFPAARSLPSAAAVTRPDPGSVYGATKLAQEHVLAAWCRARSVPLTVLRLQNVYGPGQSLTNSYTGIVALFSQLARAGEAIPLYEDGRVTRDFVYIEDVASAFHAALLGPREPLVVADIGSGVGSTIQDMAQELAAFHGAPAPVVNGRFRDGDVRHASCSIEDARRLLGWEPQWPLARGLAGLQSWIETILT
jgi:dTDP-L-rhamnose 4-epimerase